MESETKGRNGNGKIEVQAWLAAGIKKGGCGPLLSLARLLDAARCA